MQTIWLSPTDFVTGDPTLQISYPSVSHPSTIVTCTSPGDLKWVSMGLPLPQNITIHEVTVCYELSNAGSFISQVRLVEMSTPNQALVRHDDPTDLKSTSPTCYASKVAGFTPSVAVILELRLNFQNTSDEIKLGAVGVTFESGVGCCVSSIADLKALNAGAVGCLTVLGYYAPGDSGGGEFYWDASSLEHDNGGTVIAPTSNPAAAGRWKRLIQGPFSVRWFGAKGNGVADDSGLVQSAINAVQVVDGTLFFPVGTYQLDTNVDFPVAISVAFDNGATLAPISGVVVTMNGQIRAGLYKIFTIGAGLVRGFSNVPYLFPQWWGAKADGTHDDGPAIQAALDAVPVPYETPNSNWGGAVILSSGHYVSYQGLVIKAHGTTVTGQRTAYSYAGNVYGTQIDFLGGTTGFDFCMGLANTDPDYYPRLRVYCKISQLVINGQNTLQNGIRMASSNLIEEVTVTFCTNAGILLDRLTNQVQINKCSASENHVGLYSLGPDTTIWSCKQSNWRQNDIGVRIEGGMLVEMENCVIESNNSYGMEIYAPATPLYLNHLNFKELWFENNCCNSNDRFALYVHSDHIIPNIDILANIRFEQCVFGASTDLESCINIQQAQFVTFDECLFGCSNPDRDNVLGPGALDTYFKNCNGSLPADIATKGTNTISVTVTHLRNIPTYGTTISIDATLGNQFAITATDGNAFSMTTPANGYSGQAITITIKNASGGALGTMTWASQYKMAAWASPADGFSRSITFQFDGTNWTEVSRTGADVPN